MPGKLLTATVEIYHDTLSGPQATEPVVAGLDIVSAIAGNIEITRDDRQIRIAKRHDQEINMDKIRWPRFSTDLAIVLSDRTIATGMESLNNGYELRCAGITSYAARVAIISTTTSNIINTVAHETGHLFGIKRSGKQQDPAFPGHCLSETCMMYWGHVADSEQAAFSEKKQTERLFERLKLKNTQPATRPVETHREFCDECSYELSTRSKFNALRRIGINLP